MPAGAATSLARSLRIIAIGVRLQKRWFAVAVVGSALYGVMTVATAWAVGHVTKVYIAPAAQRHEVTAGQLAAIGGWVAGAVVLTVVGVVLRRVAAGVTMYNVGAE